VTKSSDNEGSEAVSRTARGSAAGMLLMVMVAGTLALVALPFGWILLVARLADALSVPGSVAVLVLLAGMPALMLGGIKLLLSVNSAYEAMRGHNGPTVGMAPVWRRSLTDGTQSTQRRMLDIVMVISVCSGAVALCVFFFAFSGSSIHL
jgi:hypothetical protein